MDLKKGLSPIVATVILIAFAILLGIVVMSFGSTYYENSRFSSADQNDSILCKPITLEVYSVQGNQQLCYGGMSNQGFVKFTLVSKSNVILSGIQVWVVGNNILALDPVAQGVEPGYPIEATIAYDFEKYGTIRQIQFIPKIKVPLSEKQIFCFNESIRFENIKQC